MTNRPYIHVDEEYSETCVIAHLTPTNGYDSCCNPIDYDRLDGGDGNA